MTDAKKKFVTATIENGTVPYDLKVKYKAAQVMVHPASKGT
jgi:small subunit ribosomal protein S5